YGNARDSDRLFGLAVKPRQDSPQAIPCGKRCPGSRRCPRLRPNPEAIAAPVADSPLDTKIVSVYEIPPWARPCRVRPLNSCRRSTRRHGQFWQKCAAPAEFLAEDPRRSLGPTIPTAVAIKSG